MKKINSIFKIVIIAIVFSYVPVTAGAWGMLGHRIVGQIAENHLSAKARKALRAILGDESTAMASNWGDFIKSDPAYNYLYNWHFVNLPEGLDKRGVDAFLDEEKAANVYNKIPEMIAVLKDTKSTADQKKLALRLLIHLVGDLNQPMHTARKDDLGGNKVYVTWFGEKSNLHRVWDESLIGYQELSYTEYAAAIDHPTKDQLNAWKSASLKDFVYGSYVACNKIYANTKAEDKLSYKYNFDFVGLLNEQLLKGGICLANILNDTYK
ncbi:MAG TPA: S1/P1 nuclease [Pedobacter sp.]|uniref:S1/P1 nuclease n=1 Tax=Pedobacter sp. TaxID=1411316 RepID=UPI002C5242BD|nr:S1/P1 nuclease [Pedobacter sp.]HMI04305.1 S1/P1 nuclease [Pedobacter sp.]